MILWGFQNHHFESTYSCQIRNPTVFDIRCNDIDITQGVPPWSDNGPHRIDNLPVKNGSCWSYNDYISESCGSNDFPVNALLPVLMRFVEDWIDLYLNPAITHLDSIYPVFFNRDYFKQDPKVNFPSLAQAKYCYRT
jgi:hypothetical protein